MNAEVGMRNAECGKIEQRAWGIGWKAEVGMRNAECEGKKMRR